MDLATWAVLLMLLGFGLLGLEFFVPSGGALGVLCALCLVGAIVLGFLEGRGTGLAILLTECIVVPAAMGIAVRWWPHTPIGRLILVQRPSAPEDVLPETIHYRGLKEFVGRRGLAKGLMLPSGSVVIDGKLFDAVSEGVPIDPGTAVIVVGVSTQRLVVRPDTTIRAELAETLDYAPELAEPFETAHEVSPQLPAESPAPPLVADVPDPFADIRLPE
jgi:membrane-bound ClpP family serine protease